jgi:hypothetical protein
MVARGGLTLDLRRAGNPDRTMALYFVQGAEGSGDDPHMYR